MKKENTNTLVFGAMMVAMTAVLMIAARYVPFVSMFSAFVCGVPMAALAARNGLKPLAPALLAIFLVSILIGGNVISAISVLLMSVIPGAVAGYMLGQNKPFFINLFSVCFAVCIGWLFELLVVEVFIGTGIEEMFKETLSQIEEAMKTVIGNMDESQLSKLGTSPDEFVSLILEMAEFTVRLYFPSLIIIISLITGYIIIRTSGFIINRTKLASVKNLPFSMLKAPRSMSFVSVACYIIYLFMGEGSKLGPVFANIVMILYTIIALCGLSVLDFKLKKKIPFGFFRFLIYLAVSFFGSALMSIISSILIVIGIIDTSRDFRRIGTTGESL